MITITSSGSKPSMEEQLSHMKDPAVWHTLHEAGIRGVNALRAATPVESGITAESWSFELRDGHFSGHSIIWLNDHVVNGVNVAIILQYGHGTGTGGYVQGRDYINPAIQPLFESIANDIWKEVTNA